MIVGFGSDLVNIERIAATLERYGSRFVTRCFHPSEQAYAEANPRERAARYAKRWAVKEATAKALGFGVRNGIYLKDIWVQNDRLGRPRLNMDAGARRALISLVPSRMTPELHLTISDDKPMAMAVVIIYARPTTE